MPAPERIEAWRTRGGVAFWTEDQREAWERQGDRFNAFYVRAAVADRLAEALAAFTKRSQDMSRDTEFANSLADFDEELRTAEHVLAQYEETKR